VSAGRRARASGPSRLSAAREAPEAQGTDKAITNAISTHVQAEQARRGNDESPPTLVIPRDHQGNDDGNRSNGKYQDYRDDT
jgi:hypothetical protein